MKNEILFRVGMAIHKIVAGMPQPELERVKPYIKEIEDSVLRLASGQNNKTNGNVIRAMSDWELAEFIKKVSDGETKITNCENECAKCENSDAWCVSQIAEWLMQDIQEV